MNIPKYRAYIKATGEIKSVAQIDFKEKYIMIYNESTRKRQYSFNEIELMQYIELKDINGIEIYKGDILTIPRYSMIDSFIENYLGLVKWIEKDARFMIDLIEEQQIINMECVGQYEIIGNIHQNPELLSEEITNE